MNYKFFLEILNKIDLGAIVLNEDLEVVFWNDYLVNLTGQELSVLKGNLLADFYSIFAKPIYQKLFSDILEKNQVMFCSGALHDVFIPAQDASDIKQNLQLESFNVANNKYVLIQVYDITNQAQRIKSLKKEIKRRQKAEKSLHQKSEEQRLLLDNVEIMVWYLTQEGDYGKVNNAFVDFFGLSKAEVENRNCEDIFVAQDAEIWALLNQKTFSTQEQVEEEVKVRNMAHQERILKVTQTPKLNSAGEVDYIVCSAIDITEQKKAENKIRHLTFRDSLTGLYNRTYFNEELDRYNTERQLPLTLVIGDVNGLKLTNDAFGHQIGDQLLVEVAKIMENACRDEDLVARWGGDEFIIFLPKSDEKIAEKICHRVKHKCEESELDFIEPNISLGYATKRSTDQDIKDIFKEAEDRMYRNKLSESKSAHSNIIVSLKRTLVEKTYETAEHAQRLKQLALKIGQELGLTDYELSELSLLAELHDLGKVAIAESIIQKPDSLNDQEWEQIKKHPQIGFQIAESSSELSTIAQGILYHHERWDGNGYPQGLEAEEIPMIARIISIVDAYDVMTQGRPYQQGLSQEEAIEELKRCAGSQFDPDLVTIFVNLLSK